ncbi:MAG TPA: winged helix-turn-helix domain-containing protein [Aliidongia sp.]|uniref:ATP-binding protein n=1 Tax=Aliidongia sp. TaxID=1914230 RepID=UPI002DDDAB67|nr:winged helix-turn-helix domain-containing protein [Aliidongia sp.]HEV2675398.1 winged helix-turn-helix domain-containing protein [Aliidongia sp.]
MEGPAARTRDVVSFGPFSLVASERLLTKDGAPLELGARTLDTLIALVSRPNEVVGKRELMAEVWPDVTVEEGSLRFHIASLRQALGDGKDGARYITTLAGRGYCFVAPVSRSIDRAIELAKAMVPVPGANFLPARLMRMVGRADGVLMLSTQLVASRFVTIVGSGGVGKTTVAVAIAHDLLESFEGAVLFFDLGMLSDPAMVAGSLASMLGLAIRSDDAMPSLMAYLRDKRLLLIIDNCEHLVEAAAALASDIFINASQVHILATSREALRVEGEQVHRLTPLAFPPEDPGLTAATALTFPATQLFIERAAASGAPLALTDADAAIVASICRKLDGVALAIELAAGRVPAYGLQQTAALLDERLSLLWSGQRTAPPRQKTLQATLDWSYGLLSALERMVFRRLAVFVGTFTIEAALAVATSPTVDHSLVFDAIDSLVAKSMVATRAVGAMMRYRLLATTRAYALDIGIDDAERIDLATRHATYCRRWLEQAGAEWPTLSTSLERAPHLAGLGNVRAALEWCFGIGGNIELGIGLAAAAAPVFLAMSLLTECHRWSERAIGALDDAACGGAEEMQLQAGLGLSSMFTRGSSEAACAALNRSLAIAEDRNDALTQLQLLSILNMFHGRVGDPRVALAYARRSATVAGTIADPAAMALAQSLVGISLHFTGDLAGARAALEAALQQRGNSQRTGRIYLGFEHRSLAGSGLARTLWLQGHPAQAIDRARQTVADAAATDHPVTISIALLWAVSVFLWIGDLESAEQHIDWFVSRAESHSLGPYLAVGRGFKGQLAIRRGDAESGVEDLQDCLRQLHDSRYELLTPPFNTSLVQGLAALGRWADAMALVDQTIGLVEANGDLSYLPELLRVNGGLLLSMPQPNGEGAEACFLQSLDLSRRQAALAWELRTAVDLAALWTARGRPDEARKLLQPVVGRFTEGRDTADLRAAERLLANLG